MWYQILYHFFREMQAEIRKKPRFSAEKCGFRRFPRRKRHTRIAHAQSEGNKTGAFDFFRSGSIFINKQGTCFLFGDILFVWFPSNIFGSNL